MNITSNQGVKLEKMNGEIRNKLNKSFARKARNAVACKAEQLGDLVVTCALTSSQLRNLRLADGAFSNV